MKLRSLYPRGPEPVYQQLLSYIYEESDRSDRLITQAHMDRDLDLALTVAGMETLRSQQGFSNSRVHTDWVNRHKHRQRQYLALHVKRKKRWKWITRGSCMAVLLGMILYVGMNHPFFAPEKLFGKYYAVPTLNSTWLPVSEMPQPATAPLLLYAEGEYDQALDQLQALAATYPQRPDLLLCMGVCYLELQQVSDAIHCFNQVRQAENPILAYLALWQLGFAYLKAENLDAAIATFALCKEKASSEMPREWVKKAKWVYVKACVRRFVSRHLERKPYAALESHAG